MTSPLDELIKRQNLEDLIGESHRVVLESLLQEDKGPIDITNEVKQKSYVTTVYQTIRVLEQLKRISCVKQVGSKTIDAQISPYPTSVEPIYRCTVLGKQLLKKLSN